MTKPQTERSATRSHVHEVEIAATPAQVWKAITDAEQIVNWFSLHAESKPVVGGEIVYQWNDLRCPCRIQQLEPEKHLRTTWSELTAASDPTKTPLLVDWTLESRAGKTILRLVHSGFGRDASFDAEYDGTKRGWHFELASLKHWLERHPGQKRHAFWLAVPTRHSAEETWRRLLDSKALVRETDLAEARPGQRYRHVFAIGETIEGVCWSHEAPIHFEGTAETFGDGLFRLGFEWCCGKPLAYLGLSTWRSTREAVNDVERRWRASLERALA
jgi:uncharacterized protein YndB with AHSA1/START domain